MTHIRRIGHIFLPELVNSVTLTLVHLSTFHNLHSIIITKKDRKPVGILSFFVFMCLYVIPFVLLFFRVKG